VYGEFFLSFILYVNSSFFGRRCFSKKKPCCAPQVLDVVDCPAYNIEHDILYYPKFYDPLYYPEYYPEIFVNIDTVREWLEFSLKTHITNCGLCLRKFLSFSDVTVSISWEDKSYVVLFLIEGNPQQHWLSFYYLESSRYSHCKFLSTFGCEMPTAANINHSSPVDSSLPYIFDKELPAWLFYTEDLYELHLSDLSISVLAAAAKSCLQSSKKCSLPERKKSCYISTIVSHFVANHSQLISSSSSNGLCYGAFVDYTEQIYSKTVAALLREPPFRLAPVINRTLNTTLLFFNESVDELVARLCVIPQKNLTNIIKQIPAHRRPVLSGVSHQKMSNSLVDHILRCISYLFGLSVSELYENVLSFSSSLTPFKILYFN